MIGICAFCDVTGDLQRSHIIPEFFYGYDDRHRLLVVKGDAQKPRFEQKGWREHLLCRDCEQFFNDRFEKPMTSMWLDAHVLPKQLTSDRLEISGLDYATFKLFHLSVLWRAAVAKGAMFNSVRLDKHQQEIQRMLAQGDAGTATKYPVIGVAVRLPGDNAPGHDMVLAPFRTRMEGQTIYCTMFGGCAWYYVISSHALRTTIQACALSESGKLLLPVEDPRELAGFAQVWETYDTARRANGWSHPWQRLGSN